MRQVSPAYLTTAFEKEAQLGRGQLDLALPQPAPQRREAPWLQTLSLHAESRTVVFAEELSIVWAQSEVPCAYSSPTTVLLEGHSL